MSRQSVLLLIVGVSHCSQVFVSAQPAREEPAEKRGAVSHVVVVIDSTESMSWAVRAGQGARADLARQAAGLVLDLVPAGTPLSVLALQDGMSAVRPMSPLQATDRHGIRASLRALRPKGQGTLSSCFSEVEQVLAKNQDGELLLDRSRIRPLVVVITDGDDCRPSGAHGHASVLSSQYEDRLRFAVIGLCNQKSVEAQLRALARSGGGWYSQLESADGLEAAFAQTRDECEAIRKLHIDSGRQLGRRHEETLLLTEQLRAQLAATTEKLKGSNGKLTETTNQLEECRKLGAEKDLRIEALQKEVSSLNGSQTVLQDQLKQQQTSLAAMTDRLAGLTKELEEEQERADQASQKFDTITRNVGDKIETLTSKEETLIKKVEEVKTAEEKLKEELGGWHPFFNSSIGVLLLSALVLFFKNPALKGVVRSLVSDEAFSGQFTGVRSQVGSVKLDVDSMKTEVGSVRSDIGAVGSEVGAMKTDVGSVKSEVTAVKTEIGGVRSGIDEVKASVASVHAGVEEKVQQLNSQVAVQLTSFDRQLAERMQRFEAQLRETSLTLTSDIGTASSSVRTVETKVDSTSAKADEIEKAITAVQNQLAQSNQFVASQMGIIESSVAETRNDIHNSIKESVVARLDSIEETVAETKTEVDEKQRILTERLTTVGTDVRAAVTESGRTVEAVCRESGAQIAQKVDGVGSATAGLHADLQQIETELRHVSQAVSPLARTLADSQASLQVQSSDARVELEKKFNKLTREVTKAVEKVHGRVDSRTKEIGKTVRDAQQNLDRQVRKQVRGLEDSVVERVAESVHGRLTEHQDWQSEELQGVHRNQQQLQGRFEQVSASLEDLQSQVTRLPESVDAGVHSRINELTDQLEAIVRDAETARRETAREVADSVSGVTDSVSTVASSVHDLDLRLNDVAKQIEQLRGELTRPSAPDHPEENSPGELPGISEPTGEPAPEKVSEEQSQAVKDLRRVIGIGPKFASSLYLAGVPTVEALATLSDERIAEVKQTVPNVEDLISAARLFLFRGQ